MVELIFLAFLRGKMKFLTFEINERYYIINSQKNSLQCLDKNGICTDMPPEHLKSLVFELVELLCDVTNEGSIKIDYEYN